MQLTACARATFARALGVPGSDRKVKEFRNEYRWLRKRRRWMLQRRGQAVPGLPKGLHKRGDWYIVRYRHDGKWIEKRAGTDLQKALAVLERHRPKMVSDATLPNESPA